MTGKDSFLVLDLGLDVVEDHPGGDDDDDDDKDDDVFIVKMGPSAACRQAAVLIGRGAFPVFRY